MGRAAAPGWRDISSSDENFPDGIAEVDIKPLSAGDFQPAGIESELVKDSGVNIRHVVPIFDGMEAQLVGRAVNNPRA